MNFKTVKIESKINTIYMFVNESQNICGIHLDFDCIQKTFIMGDNMTNVYNWYEDGDRNTVRIEFGSDIYEAKGDKIIWVDIKSEVNQIYNYINKLK